MRTPLPVDPSLLVRLMKTLVPREVSSAHAWLVRVLDGNRGRKEVDRVFDKGVGWRSAIFVGDFHSAHVQVLRDTVEDNLKRDNEKYGVIG